jgi:hypothetical protein
MTGSSSIKSRRYGADGMVTGRVKKADEKQKLTSARHAEVGMMKVQFTLTLCLKGITQWKTKSRDI